MSLLGSLQTAGNTLQVMQIGLQVTSNNIANANTEGFVRERVNYAPAPVLEIGNLQIGLGVEIESITQVIDEFLGEQLRDASADRAGAEILNDAYKDLEQLLGELTSSDLSTAISNFFHSIEDTLNAGGGDTLSVRNLATLAGEQLATEIRRIEDRAQDLRNGYDQQIEQLAGTINQLTTEIAELNVRITAAEGGSAGSGDAGALRSARREAIDELTSLTGAIVTEQPSGGVSIAIDGEFLVFEGQRREISVIADDNNSEQSSILQFTDTEKEIEFSTGEIYGLSVARDEVVDGFRESLSDFAATLIFEFNRVHSQGQGTIGFETLTSQERVLDASAPLHAAGLPFTPENGSFNITLVNDDGTTSTTTIQVRLTEDGLGDSDSLTTVAAQIDAIEGLTATVTSEGRLSISADAADTQFTFSEDSSGFLAAVGLNTFFTGSGSADIDLNSELAGIENAGKLALSLDGLGGTTENAIQLAGLIDQPLDALDGASLTERYDQTVNELSQNSTVAGSVYEGLLIFEGTLQAEFQAVTGVNIDEEAIELIALQNIYQAAARVIQTIQQMLDTLVNL